MESKIEILETIENYLIAYPGEAIRLQVLQAFLSRNNDRNIFSRKNFDGHLTASAFIINQAMDKMLLIHHRFLNRWLQPGGHIDTTDTSLVQSALREAQEETGIKAEDMELLQYSVFDFDSHMIPENKKKNEPAHYHHDVRFLFKARQDHAIEIAADESTDAQWIDLQELVDIPEFAPIVEKIKWTLY